MAIGCDVSGKKHMLLPTRDFEVLEMTETDLIYVERGGGGGGVA